MEIRRFIPHSPIKGGFFQTIFPFYFDESPKDFIAGRNCLYNFQRR